MSGAIAAYIVGQEEWRTLARAICKLGSSGSPTSAVTASGTRFPSKRSRAGHLTTIARRFCEARKKAGVPQSLVLCSGLHDFSTRVLKHTGNLAAVMPAIGHKDVKTAMQYQHPKLEMVRDALNQSGPTNVRGAASREISRHQPLLSTLVSD